MGAFWKYFLEFFGVVGPAQTATASLMARSPVAREVSAEAPLEVAA